MRILVLGSDAFGGYGGIAKYNRDMISALCDYPGLLEVVAIPRRIPMALESLPSRLTYVTDGIYSKFRYFLTVLRRLISPVRYDLICCGHLNLLPLAYLAKWKTGAPLILVIYGADAWHPPGSTLKENLLSKVDAIISISKLTKDRFLAWARVKEDMVFILPNAVEQQHYGVGIKNPELLNRYGLTGKIVLLTLGRLSAIEQGKGFDEVIELLPSLSKKIPEIAYLIVGDGDDRRRLEDKARSLRVEDRVVFTGFIEEKEKADHYRLADAYIMAGRLEGFGFAFLEALACGIPVVGSRLDGSREALRDGALGILVDPRRPDDLEAGILEALKRPRGVIPAGLEYFSFENFEKRCHGILRQVIKFRGAI
jgi:phosphatidylinositol alpha-1,6-mannosyltransferase